MIIRSWAQQSAQIWYAKAGQNRLAFRVEHRGQVDIESLVSSVMCPVTGLAGRVAQDPMTVCMTVDPNRPGDDEEHELPKAR
ncbi:MAG: hypothetical protein RMM98_10120 [Acidobacteriota bacterium]|nr:hypothetical protein [Blastocatellia bacterium]MDW8239960.1 hypothetical protein [Acidobacteriota bacterium]